MGKGLLLKIRAAPADIHALGVVLYELLTGELPYQGRTPTAVREQILLRQPKNPSKIADGVPKELEQVCLKCLAKHPADRFTNASELLSVLDQQETPRSMVLALSWLLGGLLLVILALLVWQPWATHAKPDVSTPYVKNDAFIFDGTNRIVTPLKRFAPATLEAWINPSHTDAECHFVIGSDVRTKFGIGLGICGSTLTAETIDQLIRSSSDVPVGEWSHVAGVFAEAESRLYLNGKLVHTGPPTKPVVGDVTFVIGNVGPNNLIDHFRGQIRCVRISKGVRYTTDFIPDESFDDDSESDTPAVLVFVASHSTSRGVSDLSGNGNDGRWERLLD